LEADGTTARWNLIRAKDFNFFLSFFIKESKGVGEEIDCYFFQMFPSLSFVLGVGFKFLLFEKLGER